MSKLDIDLPSDWTERTADEQSKGTLVEYQLQSNADTIFMLAIRRPSDVEGYKIRLSTVTPGLKPTRHDYSVEEYETSTAALKGSEAFLEHLSTRFREGSLSRDDPGIEATRATIQDFTDHRPFSSIRRFVRILRR